MNRTIPAQMPKSRHTADLQFPEKCRSQNQYNTGTQQLAEKSNSIRASQPALPKATVIAPTWRPKENAFEKQTSKISHGFEMETAKAEIRKGNNKTGNSETIDTRL